MRENPTLQLINMIYIRPVSHNINCFQLPSALLYSIAFGLTQILLHQFKAQLSQCILLYYLINTYPLSDTCIPPGMLLHLMLLMCKRHISCNYIVLQR